MKFKNSFTMRTQSKTIFLDPSSPDINLDNMGLAGREKVSVVLSPSLYWVKKLSLRVKYVRDVIKLLPSIFEDTLPEGNYSYTAYKCGEDFFAFAYEDKLILDTIANKGILLSNVTSVHFAQSELDSTEGAISVNETQSLYVKDGIVILVPCCWIEEKGDLDLSTLTLSKHKVVLQKFGHIVDNKSLYKIAVVLLVFILLVSTELFITSKKTSGILESRDAVFSKYKLKSTMFQNKSMLKKYSSIHKKQTKLRESIGAILSLKLKSDEKISFITLKSSKLKVEFSGVKQGSDSHISKSLKSKKIVFKRTFKGDTMHLEVEL